MQIECPKCKRNVPWEAEHLPNHHQELQCPWCLSRFVFQEQEAADLSVPISNSSETWELDVEQGDDVIAPNNLMAEFDFVDSTEIDSAEQYDLNYAEAYHQPEALSPNKAAHIPDLPAVPDKVAKFVQMEHTPWMSNISDSPNVPELPQMDFDITVAPKSDAPTKPVKQIEQIGPSANLQPSKTPQREVVLPWPSNTPPPITNSSNTSEPSLSDLLASLVSENNQEEEHKSIRYYVRRGQKEYGPFTETEVMSLLEARKLQGNELSRSTDSDKWIPLHVWPDFRPTIEILQKVPARMGWEKDAPRPSSENFDAPKSASSLDELSPASPYISDISSQAPEAPSKPSSSLVSRLLSLRLPIIAGVILLLGGGLALWWSQDRDKAPTKTVKHNQELSIKQLAISDQFTLYSKLLNELVQSHRQGAYSPNWLKIRFAYYLLDSYGNDRSIYNEAKTIHTRLKQREKSTPLMLKIDLARAIYLRDLSKISTLLKQTLEQLPPTDPEWGYIRARAKELLGKIEQAAKLYQQLINKHPEHIRALLGLYRVHLALQQTDLASTYLWRAFHKAPTHLPSQLAALSYAIEHNTWLSQSSNIRKRIEQLINKRQYTNASKAQWLVLQAREFWRNRQTDAAIHSIEQATTLDSENRYHRWLQIQFHLWSYQPHIARQLITRERKYADHPQLVIWDFEAMKQYATAENLLKYLEGFSEYDPKQPQRQYLYYYLLALHYVAQDAKPAAIASCERALTMADVQISPPFAHLLMLKLLIETRQFKKAIQQLKNMPPDTPPHQLLFLQGQLQIAQKQYKEAENTAIQIQKQYPIYYQGHLLQAELRVAQNQINPALSAYRKALLFHHQRPSLLLIPMVKLYIDSKEYREALRLIERYENAKKGELSCSLLLHKLTALFQLKQCSQLLSLEIKHCSHFQFHFLRGQCAIQNNSTEQALSELQKANRLAPRLLEPLEAIADLYYNTKQYNEAVKAYRQLLDRNPRNKLYVLRISHIYRHRQLYPKALQLLQRYVPASSADIDLNLERARILVALSQHGPALRTYGNLSKIKLSQAQRVELLIGHANLLLQQKKYAVALKLYSEALSLNPQNLDALFAQIRVFFHLQQFKACVDTATKYLSSASPDVTNRPQVTLLLNTCRTRLKNPAP